ncbi:MAG: type II secretion system protein GspG [Verrucomicrobiota bacterium]
MPSTTAFSHQRTRGSSHWCHRLIRPASLEKQLGQLPLDPWNNVYQYRYPSTRNNGSFDVDSRGPGGTDNSDDIGNWPDPENVK